MTVSSSATFAGPYTPNGSTVVFPFSFAARAKSEIVVKIDGLTVSPSMYTVTLAPDFNSGSVTFTTAPTGAALYVVSAPSFQQGTQITNQGAFSPSVIEAAFDRAAIRDLFLKAGLDRALKLPIGSPTPGDLSGSGYVTVAPDGSIAIVPGNTELTEASLATVQQMIVSAIAGVQAAVNGLTTTSVAEGGNLYFTAARARSAITGSSSATFNQGTGQISITKPNLDAAAGFTIFQTQGSSTIAVNNGVLSVTSLVLTTAGGFTLTAPFTLSGPPTANLHPATKQYVDERASGIKRKTAARVATTGNILLNGTQTIDGVAVAVGDIVLVKNQTDATQNGIYIVASGAWTRSTEADSWDELVGAVIFISSGTANAGSSWGALAQAGGTIGTTAINWTQSDATSSYVGSAGITVAGSTISLTAGYVALLGGNNTYAGVQSARTSGTAGGASLVPGDTASTGYHSVYGPDGTRVAALGYTITGQPTQFIQDKGNGWAFTGGPISSDSDPTSASHLIRRSWLDTLSASNPGTSRISASQYRTLQQALSTFGVNVMDKGAKGDSPGYGSTGTDDTAAFMAAVATGARIIRVPSDTGGKFRLTSRFQPNLISGASRSLKIIGDGVEGHAANSSPDGTPPGNGSWLYFDHTDEGLHLENSTGNEVYGLASIRNQPANVNSGSVTASISGTTMTVTAVGSGKVNINAVITGGTILPGTKISSQLTGSANGVGTYQVSRSQTVASTTVTIGWVPNPNSWDWVFINGHFNVDNLFSWNATNFLTTDYNGAGQFNAGYLSCNAFAEGLRWDRQLGLPLRVGTFKLWPFEDFGGPQAQYAYQNLIGMHARHADGASVDAFFAIGARVPLLLNNGSDGQPPRDTTFKFVYADLHGYAGVVVDPSAVGGNFAITNLITQGATSADSNPAGATAGVILGANSFQGDIGTLRGGRYNEQIAIVTGNSSHLSIGPDIIFDWGASGSGASAYSVTGTSSSIDKSGRTVVTSGSGPISDGSGRIFQASYAAI